MSGKNALIIFNKLDHFSIFGKTFYNYKTILLKKEFVNSFKRPKSFIGLAPGSHSSFKLDHFSAMQKIFHKYKKV